MPKNININAAHLVVREADEDAKERASRSYIINPKKYCSIPRISHEGLVLGKHLASGSFNDVYEVKEIKTGHIYRHESDSGETVSVCSSEDEDHENIEVTTSQAHNILARDENRYVVKFLSQNVVSNLSAFRTGSTDLSLEARYLASLDHPNIISLRGVADNVMAGLLAGFGGGYFLLLDRLHCTLEQRIAKWHHQQQRARLLFRKKRDKQDNFAKRLHIAAELSEALRYLHSLGIVYRDLKPENVGFRSDGKLQLFDFGLAKELHPSERLADDLYRMTGSTGSLRYMAPEVGRNMPYNLSADVYSLSVLLWELCSLRQPYEGMSRESHAELVLYGQFRPPVNESWSEPLKQLLADGWSEDIRQRPQMDTFQYELKEAVKCAISSQNSFPLNN